MRSSVSSLALTSEESFISLSGMSQDLPQQQQQILYKVDFDPETTNFNPMDTHIQSQRNTFGMEPGIDATSAEPPPSFQRQAINNINLPSEIGLPYSEGLHLQPTGGIQPISMNPIDMNTSVYLSSNQTPMESYPGSIPFSQRGGSMNLLQTYETDRQTTNTATQMGILQEVQQFRHQIDSAIPTQNDQTFPFSRNESQGIVASSSSTARQDKRSNLMAQPTISRSSSGSRRSEPRQTSDKRRGKDRVVKLCSQCKEKNHIRRNQCVNCKFDMAKRRPSHSSRAQRNRTTPTSSSNTDRQKQNTFQTAPIENSVPDSRFASNQNPNTELRRERIDHTAPTMGFVQARQLSDLRNQRTEIDNNNQGISNVEGSYLDIGHGGLD